MIKNLLKFYLILKGFIQAMRKKLIKVFKLVQFVVFLDKKRSYLMQCTPVCAGLAKAKAKAKAKEEGKENMLSESGEASVIKSPYISPKEYRSASQDVKWEIIDFLKKNNPELIKKLEAGAKSKGFELNLNKDNYIKTSESDGCISPLSLDDSSSEQVKAKSGSITPNALELNKQNYDAFLHKSKQDESAANVDINDSSSKSETQFDSPDFLGIFIQDNTTPEVKGLEEFNNTIISYTCIILSVIFLVMVIYTFKQKIRNIFKNKAKLISFVHSMQSICFFMGMFTIGLSLLLMMYFIELYIFKHNFFLLAC